jgi:hypothetical protein
MPAVVAAVIAVVVEIGETVGPFLGALFTGGYGTFAATLAFSAAFTGGSYLIRHFLPKPSLPSFDNLANQQISVRQAIAPREIVYGKVKKGGTLALLEMSGSSNEYRHLILLLAGHQIAGVDETWFDDKQIFFDGSGNATGDYAGFAYQEVHLGDPADTTQPFPRLVTDLPARWGSTDLIRGVAKVHLRIKLDPNKFPSGLPNPKFVIRGRLVFDPRSSTTGYSNNAALCGRDYASLDRNKGGYGIPTAELDDSLVIAAANVSDENVALAAGGTEKRYTANGIITTDSDPKQAMVALLTAMAGDMYCIGGLWRMYAGAWRAPTAPTITASDFRGDIAWNPIATVADSFNAVKGVYVSPLNDYQASDFPPVTNSTYETEDGGRIFSDITLPFTDTSTRAQRIAKILLESSRRAGRGTLPLKLTQLNVCAPDNIAVTFADFSWSAKTLQITRSAFAVDQAGRNRYAYGTDLEVKETDANVYTWSTADETTPGASSSANAGDLSVVQPITALALSADSVAAADGRISQRLIASWTAPTDQLVTAAGKILVAYKKHADVVWTNFAPLDGATTKVFVVPVFPGTAYDVRVTAQNAAGAKSADVEQDNFVVNPDPGAPALSVGKSLLNNGGFESNNIGTAPGHSSPPTNPLPYLSPVSDGWYIASLNGTALNVNPSGSGNPVAWSVYLDDSAGIFARTGGRSLLISVNPNVSVPNQTFYYEARVLAGKLSLRIGDIIRISGYLRWDFNIAVPAGFSILQRIGLVFYDASDNWIGELSTDTGTPNAAFTFAQTSLQIPATMSGVAPAYCRVECSGFIRNTTGGAISTPNGLCADLRFEDMVVVLQNTAFDLTPINTSGIMIGGPALSQSGATTTILIAAKTFQFGDGQVSYNSGSVTPGAGYGTYFVYADDPTYSGGAVTYVATATESVLYAVNGRVYFGKITTSAGGVVGTPTDGGTGSGKIKLP